MGATSADVPDSAITSGGAPVASSDTAATAGAAGTSGDGTTGDRCSFYWVNHYHLVV